MAATLSGTYTSAPDTPSPVFPDRLIRPLPKRPIRSRLSPAAAESILYPPAPPATQLFYSTYTGNGEVVNDAKVYVQNSYGYERSPDRDHRHPYDDGMESGEEDGPVVVRRSGPFHRSSLSPQIGGQKYAKQVEGVSTKVASFGPDGYDAFENTNNKKKRKIPTSGNLGSHSNLSTDMANMALSTAGGSSVGSLDESNVTGPYYGSGNSVSPSGSGISGPGRGRYGRSAGRSIGGRTPLSVHVPNAWLGGRSGTVRREVAQSLSQEQIGDSGNNSEQGIISAAIANAAALSSSTPQGQENISLLDQTRKATPTKTQFTFTCESDSSKGMAWQTRNPYSIPQQQHPGNLPSSATTTGQQRFATQGTQTSPNMATQVNQQGQQGSQPQTQGGQPSVQGKKSRRSAGSAYAFAARQRRIQQQYTNLHHPPNIEDIWICEFCEYESIFGHPPEALIRQYEIKDRKERRRLAEKRRLLEKAKMKGRKGKKATKNAVKNTATQHPSHQQAYDRQPAADQAAANHGVMSDDYLGDEFVEETGVPLAPQSSPLKQSVPANHHVKTPAAVPSKGLAGGGTGRSA